MGIDDPADNGKSQSGSIGFIGHKGLKDLVLLFFGDTTAGILNLYSNIVVLYKCFKPDRAGSVIDSAALRRILRNTSLSFVRSAQTVGRERDKKEVNSIGPSMQEEAKESTICSINSRKENTERLKDVL